MSHVISFSPKQADQQIRSLKALSMAIECIEGLEMVVMKDTAIGPDGILYQKGKPVLNGHEHFRTWKDDHGGRLVGDWDLPAGTTEKEVGENAVAVIRLKPGSDAAKSHPVAYEVGVIPHQDADGKITYALQHDFYSGGRGIEEYVGKTEIDRSKKIGPRSYEVKHAHGSVLQHYQMMCIRMAAEEAGHSCEFAKQTDGSYIAVVDKENVGVAQ